MAESHPLNKCNLEVILRVSTLASGFCLAAVGILSLVGRFAVHDLKFLIACLLSFLLFFGGDENQQKIKISNFMRGVLISIYLT